MIYCPQLNWSGGFKIKIIVRIFRIEKSDYWNLNYF